MKSGKKMGRDVKDVEVEAREPKVFANLTYDSGFKIVLGTEGRSEKLLMTLLDRLLGLKLVNVQYLPNERLGLTEEDNKSFFDVYCKDSRGRRFLIEMQMWSQHYFHKRAVYYSSLSVQDQARLEKQALKKEGRAWDYYFAPVYQISFLNFPNTIVDTKEEGANPYISHYVYRSKDTGKELEDETNIIFIDLQKFRKKWEECENSCEQWLYSIKNMHLLRTIPKGLTDPELIELYNEAHFAGWPAEKRAHYEKLVMNRNDYENILYENREDAKAEGRMEGHKEGYMEGRMEGHLLMAKKMLEDGIDAERVCRISGLTIEEIMEAAS